MAVLLKEVKIEIELRVKRMQDEEPLKAAAAAARRSTDPSNTPAHT